MKTFLPVLLILCVLSCNSKDESIVGRYQLSIENAKNINSGELEIVGEENDYFGKITLVGKRTRVYEIGLSYKTEDSLHFVLPGSGGYLSLKKGDSTWQGKFKYFGIKADINAHKVGEASKELMDLVSLKPLSKDIISTNKEESFPSYDSKNQVLYFTQDGKIVTSQFENGEWNEPLAIDFNEGFSNNKPNISSDGNTLLFSSNRPVDSSTYKKKNIWLLKRNNGDWSTPTPLPHPINIDSIGDYHPSISENGNIYFISYNRANGFGRSDIYKATKNPDSSYSVNNLGDTINSELSEADVFIHPKEQYLLFASTGRADSYGADDIYISFNNNGQWTKPVNLGSKINTYAYEYGAWVDLETEYLYFNSYRRGTSDIYRIKLSEIEAFN